jgi:Protein of unknown function (DUF1236)
MRNKLLVSAAALLAGMAVASAQNMPSGQGGAQQPSGAQSQSAPSGAQQRGGQAQQQRSQEKQTTGQAQREPGAGAQKEPSKRSQAQPQRGQEKSTTGQAQPGANSQKEPSKQGQAQPQRGQKDHTTGQGSPQASPQGSSPSGQSPMQQGQTQQRPAQPGQSGVQGRTEQGGSAGGNVTLTTEQRTKIRETVLAGGNVPRANNVNFALTVGTAVPTSVRVVEVPTTLIEIHPEWRGHMYFVVGDEIIIVDRNHRIVAVIAV